MIFLKLVSSLLALTTFAVAQLHATNKCHDVDGDLPNWWCEETESFCISLDNSTTSICCPWLTDNDCQTIPEVSCDMSLYDPEKNVSGIIRTTRTNDQFRQCYNQCCPFGYTCSNKECVMIVEEAVYGNPLDLARGKCTAHCDSHDYCCNANCITPGNTECANATSTSTPSMKTTDATSATHKSTATESSENAPSATATQSSGSASVTPSGSSTLSSSLEDQESEATSTAQDIHEKLVGGLVGGIVSAAILTLVAFLLWRRRRKQPKGDDEKDHGTDATAVSNKGKEKASVEPNGYTTPPNQIIGPSLQQQNNMTLNGTITRDFAVPEGVSELDTAITSPNATVSSEGAASSTSSGAAKSKSSHKIRRKSISVTDGGSPVKEPEVGVAQ